MHAGWLLGLVGVLVLAAVVVVSARSVSERGIQRIMRCRSGHLFTSMVIPGASLKAVRLGTVRFQRCPVGSHWTFVRQVDPTALTDEQRAEAARYHDDPVP